MTHESLWNAIQKLAHTKGLSLSGMARRAGLNPTTFNPCKRFTRTHIPRWPTFETLNKVLKATDTTWKDFINMIPEEEK